ncbi:MAG: hypothetical protein K6F28_10415 [Lachnospiraceae bacterium]|nr:hypothetical protein [Lachnospiraceae bacterium]
MITEKKFREFIERQNWIFAKTYADRAPHEYVVRGKLNGTDEEFLEIIAYIRESGITMYFWNHPNKYVFMDDRQYWVMCDKNDEPVILNRCNLEEYKIPIEWRGITNSKS